MFINIPECEHAGLDPKKVERIAKGLSRYLREAESLGIELFGGSGTGSLRFDDGHGRKLVLGYVEGHVDGGDGSTSTLDGGLERGE
ncbi:hypothetical protein [Marinobacter salsuginis]|uniref:Uncharacterized protein n=1 Tax=Marinobacter salsuginis TaxID=418719 RepID=A0A5M3Q0Q4_9GAMM|nr:hypothetical protein [Marinobacter salsuginis]GBO88621.1 hypothetical protein MSSD14B_22890 [Marinobacter salsuginis]